MSNTIRIKRRANGGGAGAPATLANAELAFNEQTNILYYGTGTGGAGGSATSVIPIAGNGAFVDTTTNQTVAGIKTFSSTISGSVDGNAGTATKLATSRLIYGNGFDGSANLTSIITSAFGGTGNGFTKFNGPSTSEKTFILPDASATILTTNALVTTAQGGTGVSTVTPNYIFAGPATGTTAGAPTFRAIVAADLPSGSASYINNSFESRSASFALFVSNANCNSSLNLSLSLIFPCRAKRISVV